MQSAASQSRDRRWSSESSSSPVAPIEDARRKSLELLSSLDQTTLDQRRDESRWSPGEVFDHLIKFDRFFLQNTQELFSLAQSGQPTRLEYSLQQLDVGPACIPKAVLPLFTIPLTVASRVIPKPVQSFLASSLPIQHPQFATPERNRSKLELQEELRQTLVEYTELLDSPTSAYDLSKMIISHPLLGKRTLLELPEFVAVHENRHLGRMLELLNR